MMELRHALSIYEDTKDIDPEDLPSAKAILSSCQGLAVFSGVDYTVDVVPSTAREFLQKNLDKMDRIPDLTITQICIANLSVNTVAMLLTSRSV